jgi:type II secretory pathway component PulF
MSPINYGQPRPGSAATVDQSSAASGARWFAWMIGWIAIGFFGLGGLCFALGLIFGPAVGYMTPVAALLILVSLSVLSRGVRRDRDMAALNYLEQAARLNLPLPAMLHAAEISEKRQIAERLRRLRQVLEDGQPVAAALQAAAPNLAPRIVNLVFAAEHSGTLAPALHRIVQQRQPRQNVANHIYLRWYPVVLFVFAGGSAMLMSIVVMPKYQALMRDFHVRTPPLMTALIAISEWLAPLASVAAAVVLLIFCGQMLSRTFSSQGPLPLALRWPSDWLMWRLPFARTAVRARALADVCTVLADATRVGRPMEWALYDASEAAGNAVLSMQVRRWAESVLAGAPLHEAARDAGLPELLVGLISTAQGAGDMPEVFDFLSRYYDSRFSRAAQLLRGALIPMLAIGFGAIVAGMALSIFEPLISLTNALMPTKGVL